MALLRASYVLLCAVAGGDIQVIIAEKGRVLWYARCSQLSQTSWSGSSGVPPLCWSELHCSIFLSSSSLLVPGHTVSPAQ